MVLLVPKALAKQIMCINTRRIEERRGVSGKDRGAEGGQTKTISVGRGRGAEKIRALGRKKSPSFCAETRTGKGLV